MKRFIEKYQLERYMVEKSPPAAEDGRRRLEEVAGGGNMADVGGGRQRGLAQKVVAADAAYIEEDGGASGEGENHSHAIKVPLLYKGEMTQVRV